MQNGRQRQRHGVTKNLLEGLAGVLVGAAAVLFLTSRARQRVAPTERAPEAHGQRPTTGDN